MKDRLYFSIEEVTNNSCNGNTVTVTKKKTKHYGIDPKKDILDELEPMVMALRLLTNMK